MRRVGKACVYITRALQKSRTAPVSLLMVEARGIERKRILRGPPHWATPVLKIMRRLGKACVCTPRALQKSRTAPVSLLMVGARGIKRKRILRRPPHWATANLKIVRRVGKAVVYTTRAVQISRIDPVSLLKVGARGIQRKRIQRGPPHWATPVLKIMRRPDKACVCTPRALQKSRTAPVSLLMVGARGIKRKRILRGPPHWATALLKIVRRVDKVCVYTSRALQKSRIAPASLLKVGARGIERKRILRRPPHRATAILKVVTAFAKRVSIPLEHCRRSGSSQ